MANIVLTETCVRKCPYCFAKQYIEEAEDKSAISMENIQKIAAFMEKSNKFDVSLMGGEPLIHPHIYEIIEYFLRRNFDLVIFTSGIMPPGRIKNFICDFRTLPKNFRDKVTFVVNVNEPEFSKSTELEKVHTFLSNFGSNCALSFNIYQNKFNMAFLIDYILQFGLRRHVRLGLANPIQGGENKFISPDNFKQVGTRLISFLSNMYEFKIHVGLDCGFPLCMFSDEELGKLYKYTCNAISFPCTPAVDIGPDLSCWCCFPLSKVHKRSLEEFESYNDAYNYFFNQQQKYRSEVRGIYVACDTCKYFDEMICDGGCVAHVINKFKLEGDFRSHLLN